MRKLRLAVMVLAGLLAVGSAAILIATTSGQFANHHDAYLRASSVALAWAIILVFASARSLRRQSRIVDEPNHDRPAIP